MVHGKVKVKHGLITTLRVRIVSPARTIGRLQAPGLDVACAIGRSGVTRRKREGDGASPAAGLPLLYGYWRPDRQPVRPTTRLPLRPARRDLGWCDAPADRNYNRPVTLPYEQSHEEMVRADRLYDVVVVLDWNIAPRRRGRGSAIFFHLAAPGYTPTAGCVAVSAPDMRRILARLGPRARIVIG